MTAPIVPPESGDLTPGSAPPAVSGEEHPSAARDSATALELLVAEARYHRQRYDLYRARMYGSKPTSESRLRELQRWCQSAESRLAAARAALRAEPAG